MQMDDPVFTFDFDLRARVPIYAIYAIYAFAIPYLAGTGMRSEPSLGCARGYSGPSRSDVQLMHDVQ